MKTEQLAKATIQMLIDDAYIITIKSQEELPLVIENKIIDEANEILDELTEKKVVTIIRGLNNESLSPPEILSNFINETASKFGYPEAEIIVEVNNA
jgi:hypothetical protein